MAGRQLRNLAMPNSFSVLADAAEDTETDEEASSKEQRDGNIQHESGDGNRDKRRKPIKNPLFWLDLEMTGLDLDNDTIIEIACIISDGELNTLIEGPDIAIYQPDEVLSSMNAWCIENHGKSGLTQRCRDSSVGLEQAEQQVMDFLQEHAGQGSAILAGNSVHVDMAFLKRRMPRLAAHLHYRIVDVSTIKELAKRWYPRQFCLAPRKVFAHTAMSDVRESIEELRYYRQAVFKEKEGGGAGPRGGRCGRGNARRL